MRALDQVDGLKMKLPTLGPVVPGDFAGARNAALPTSVSSVEEVTSELVGYLRGMTISSHPHTQQNVIAPPTIPSLIAVLLASLHNPNIAWDEYSRLVALAEVEALGITARLVGYDPRQAGGAFTFGGTGTSLYGVKIGLEKACPGAMRTGVSDEAAVLVSDAGHYCAHNIVGWLGIGTDQLITVPTNTENEMDLDLLGEAAREALASGRRIAAIIATMGTTDSFGLDDLEAIATLRDTLVDEFQLAYRPHIHADAVIGWAWSVFNDYDFEGNPLGFRPRTLRALAGACRRIRHLSLTDSVGVDFHKTGFTPYISSLVLVKDRADLQRVARDPEQMPYLYHFGEHRPGMYTLETSRAGTGPLAAIANYRLFGREGLRVVLGHMVEMAQLLREHLEGREGTTVLNRDNFGTVTLFRAYPPGVDTFAIKNQEFEDPAFRDTLLAHNDFNRKIFQYVHSEAMAGRGVVISSTDCYRRTGYGEPIHALKSYIMSPFVDEADVEAVVHKIMEAREKVG
jgi:glutamate/tyrosine decarboxylase-like PLP-dependent enzyme